MLKKMITYKDYNDVEHTKEFCFNISKSELLELEMRTEGGLEAKINRITATEDTDAIIDMFKNIIMLSYGVKSADGESFDKSQEVKDAFLSSPAYDVLFMELVTDPDNATKFIEAIIPQDAVAAARAELDKKGSIPAPADK